MSTLNDIDTSLPLNSDSPAELAAEIRLLKETVKNLMMVPFNNNGSLKSILISSLAGDSVGTEQLVDGSVTGAKLAAGAVGEEKLASLSVGTAKLINEAVTVSKLGNQSVDNTKLANNAVRNVHLGEAVNADRLGNSTTDDAVRAVGQNHLKDGAVTDRSVTDVGAAKLSGGANGMFLYKTGGVWTPVEVAGALTFNTISGLFELSSQFKIALVGDSKARAAAGGATTADTWVERDLGELADVDNVVTFTGNSFKLVQGLYFLVFRVPASNVGRHQARLFQDNGDSTNIIPAWGSSAVASGAGVMSYSEIICVLDVSSDDWSFKIQHWCQNTVGANDLGVPASSDNTVVYGNHSEMYTQGYIIKVQ